MILLENADAVRRAAQQGRRVLDVGGWFAPLNLATHVIDREPYQTRRIENGRFQDAPERFTSDSWIVHDVTQAPWPFADKYFDFCFCSHLLEDVDEPLAVCAEMIRVAKAGYIETPSRVREIFTKQRAAPLTRLLGQKPIIGDPHHHWLVERAGGGLRFIDKSARHYGPGCFITRGELGRKLTAAESGLCLWWNGGFAYDAVSGIPTSELKRFKETALAALRANAAAPAARAIRETRSRAPFLLIADRLPHLFARLFARAAAGPATVIGGGTELAALDRAFAGTGRAAAPYRTVEVTDDGSGPTSGRAHTLRINAGRYRNSLGYRLRCNWRLRRWPSSLAVCLSERPDPLVDYGLTLAIPAARRLAVVPHIEDRFQEDGAYYLNRFAGVEPWSALVRLLAAAGPPTSE